MLSIGSVLAAIGLFWCGHTALVALRSERTEGEIVRVEKVPAKGGWSYVPVFAFRDGTGHRWEGRTPFSTASYAGYQPKQKVRVVFDPKEPMVSNLDSFGAIWTLPVFVLVWGLGFLFFSWRAFQREVRNA